MTHPTLATLLTLVFLTPATAQDVPPDCTDPQTQTAMTICAGIAFDEADAALNDAYRTATNTMRGIDDDLPEAEQGGAEALLTAQRAWIAYRDAACTAEGYLVHGGSMEPMAVAQCLTRLTEARTEDLGELLRSY